MQKTGVADGGFDVEDLSTAFLRLSGGTTLLLECSWAQWVPEDQCYVTVYGADGGAGITWVPATPHRSMQVWTERERRTRRRGSRSCRPTGTTSRPWPTSSTWCSPASRFTAGTC